MHRATTAGHVPVVMTSSATKFNLQRPPSPLNFPLPSPFYPPPRSVTSFSRMVCPFPACRPHFSVRTPPSRKETNSMLSFFALYDLLDEHTNRGIKDCDLSLVTFSLLENFISERC